MSSSSATNSSRYPGALPPGARQKVALARAVIRDPAVLLLDEPLSAIDEQFREEMRWELGHLQRQLGVTTIYVTHDQREAMSLADRIVLMNNGTHRAGIGARPHVLRPGRCLRRPVHRLAVDEPDRPGARRGRAAARRQRRDADGGARSPAAMGALGRTAAEARRASASTSISPTIRPSGVALPVDDIFSVGRERFFSFRIGDTVYQGVDKRRSPAGSEGRVHFDPEGLLFFDAATGRRVGAEVAA